MTPIDPVVGGTTLRIPSIHSPNFVHLVSGWTINVDGSAEFNDLFFRGTLMGQDFEVNANGAFFYDGTPALGNLSASIAPAAGTDEFGNLYMQGIVAYSPSGLATPVNHAQLQDGTLSIGPGVDFINSAAWFVNGGNDFSIIGNSPVSTTGPEVNPLSLLLQGGTPAAATGSAQVMRAGFFDFNGAGPADAGISGTLIQTDNTGTVNEVWHNTVLQTGWTTSTSFGTLTGLQPLQYRKVGGGDKVGIGGCFTSAAGAGTAIMALLAGFRPKVGQPLNCAKILSGTVTYGQVYVSGPAGNLNTNSQLGPLITAATGAQFSIPYQEFPLGNIP